MKKTCNNCVHYSVCQYRLGIEQYIDKHLKLSNSGSVLEACKQAIGQECSCYKLLNRAKLTLKES